MRESVSTALFLLAAGLALVSAGGEARPDGAAVELTVQRRAADGKAVAEAE